MVLPIDMVLLHYHHDFAVYGPHCFYNGMQSGCKKLIEVNVRIDLLVAKRVHFGKVGAVAW